MSLSQFFKNKHVHVAEQACVGIIKISAVTEICLSRDFGAFVSICLLGLTVLMNICECCLLLSSLNIEDETRSSGNHEQVTRCHLR